MAPKDLKQALLNQLLGVGEYRPSSKTFEAALKTFKTQFNTQVGKAAIFFRRLGSVPKFDAPQARRRPLTAICGALRRRRLMTMTCAAAASADVPARE